MVLLKAFQTFLHDLKTWLDDMGSIPSMFVQSWARLFPFPQLLAGPIFMLAGMGFNSMASWYFYLRVASFSAAAIIHKHKPFSKMMGPIMHVPFFVLVPIAYVWLWSDAAREEALQANADFTHKAHYYFVAYTTIITSISLVMDLMVATKWLMGKDVGEYPHPPKADYEPIREEK